MSYSAWIPLGFAVVALGMILGQPAPLIAGFGHPEAAVTVHLLTLGVLVSTHYARQRERWLRLAPSSAWFVLGSAVVIGLHVAGLLALAWGFMSGNRGAAFLGGHYLLPTAVALSVAIDILWQIRHRPGFRPGLLPHLPGIGLLVTVPLGVMLVMGRFAGGSGFYDLSAIQVHALAGAFLFVLPMQAALRAEPDSEPRQAGHPSRLMILAGLGLLAIALEPRGLQGGHLIGLGLLGFVALWVGLPLPRDWSLPPGETWRDVGWAAFGLLLLWGALQVRRGAGAEVGVALAGFTAVWFLLGEAVPRALLDGTASSPSASGARPGSAGAMAPSFRPGRFRFVTFAGTVLILAGQLNASPGLVRAGAAIWLLGLAWLVRARAR
jgi:hypothetical protein